MSGTSMDGLDCGLFEMALQANYTISWNLLDFNTISYNTDVRNLIDKALRFDKRNIADIDKKLGELFAKY